MVKLLRCEAMAEVFIMKVLQPYNPILSKEEYKYVCTTLKTIINQYDILSDVCGYILSYGTSMCKLQTIFDYAVQYHEDGDIDLLFYKLLIKDEKSSLFSMLPINRKNTSYTLINKDVKQNSFRYINSNIDEKSIPLFHIEMFNLSNIRIFIFLFSFLNKNTHIQHEELKLRLYKELMLCEDNYETDIKLYINHPGLMNVIDKNTSDMMNDLLNYIFQQSWIVKIQKFMLNTQCPLLDKFTYLRLI